MALSNEEVIARVCAAFKNVTLGNGVGLFEGQAIDDYEVESVQAAARAKDEKQDWSAIPAEHLNQCYSSLSFFDAEGMRFHLPAFILADLQDQLNTLDPVFTLTSSSEYARSRFTLLSAEQRAAIRDYLMFVRDNPDQWAERGRGLDRAIDSYWNTRTVTH